MSDKEEEGSAKERTADIPSCLNPMLPDFDPKKALKMNINFLGAHAQQLTQFSSFDEFELNMVKHHPDALREVLRKEPQSVSLGNEAGSETQVDEASTSAAVQGPPGRMTRAQMASTLVPARHKVFRHVWHRIEQDEYAGPLSELVRCVRDRVRCRVLIRGRSSLRSTLTCYIVAFDKHWNLALRDVDEVFYRPTSTRVFRKLQQRSTDGGGKDSVVSARATRKSVPTTTSGIVVPDVLRYQHVSWKGGHTEVLERHCNQLFVRGDNVLLVNVLEAQLSA